MSGPRSSILLCSLIVLLIPSLSPGVTHYVHPSGGGDFTAIKPAVTAASAGDTVLVAAGTYSGASNTDMDFAGKNLVLISEDGPGVTTIDCSGGSPYRRGLYFHSGEDTTSVVDGIHITKGVSVDGGAINCTGASPLIQNCVFSNCGVAYGGALHIQNSQAVVRDCEFLKNNVFVSAGAIWIENATPVIESCLIDSCTAGFIAGGVLLYDGSSATFRDVTIRNCVSGGDGAGCYAEDSPSYFHDVRFIANHADTTDGGGLYANCDMTFESCLFQENYAGGSGGGAYFIGGTPEFTGCDFISNWSDLSGGGIHGDQSQLDVSGGKFWSNVAAAGGAIHSSAAGLPTISGAEFIENEAVIMGGAIWMDYAVMPNITDCTFEGNNGGVFGGAIALEAGTAGTIGSCVFRENTAESGAAIDLSSGAAPDIASCTLEGNVAYPGDGAIASTDASPDISNTIIANTDTGSALVCTGSPTPATTHSCAHGNAAGDSLCGDYHDNMFEDPLFCSAAAGDLTLHDDSPCLAPNNAWGESVGALGAGGCGPGTSVDGACPPRRLTLFPARPNPFAGTTTIRYNAPVDARTLEIGIYDVSGRLVRTVSADSSPGPHEATWDGRDELGSPVASGVYFVRASCDGQCADSTVVLLR